MPNAKSGPYLSLFFALVFLLSRVNLQTENLSTLTADFPGYFLVLLFAIGTGIVCAKTAAQYSKQAKWILIGAVLAALFPYRNPFKDVHILCGYAGFVLFGVQTLAVVEKYCLSVPKERYLRELSYGLWVIIGVLWAGSLVINGFIEGLFFSCIFFLYWKMQKS